MKGSYYRLLGVLLAISIGIGALAIRAERLNEFGTGWTAAYYNNTDLSGSPVVSEVLSGGINFDWGTSSPRPGVVNDDNFSARFTSIQFYNAGTYEFVVSSDDGVRVIIDGVTVLDRFIGRPLTTDRFQQTFTTSGTRQVIVEYVEFIDRAAIQFQWFLISDSTQPGFGTPGGLGQPVGPTPTATRIPPTPLPAIPAGALSGTVVRAQVLLVRSGPFLGAPVVGRVLRGQTYQVLGRDERALWFLIQLSEGIGWVWGFYFNVNGNEFNAPVVNAFVPLGDPAAAARVVVQTNATLRLRAEPNLTSAQTGRVPWGDLLPVLARTSDGWYQVVFRGTVGWVASGFTTVVRGDLAEIPLR